MNSPSEPARPKLAAFLVERGLDHFQGASLLGCSGEYVRRMCLPFGDPRRCVPSRRMKYRIATATGYAVGVDDWSAPLIEAVTA